MARKLLFLVFAVGMLSSCWLFGPKESQDPLLLTFLPEDEQWEYGMLDFHENEADPEWVRAHEEVPEGVGWSGYHLVPNADSDSSGYADLTLIKDLGADFRLLFTFRVYTMTGDAPLIEFPSPDGQKTIRLLLRDKAGTDDKEIGFIEYDKDVGEGESSFITLVNEDFENRFALDRWYSCFIDVKNGSEFSLDIDERDGVYDNPSDDPAMDDDIIEHTYTFFQEQDKTSYTFTDPTFRSPWVDSTTNTDWFKIGLIYYLDCTGFSDTDWPDPHGDDY